MLLDAAAPAPPQITILGAGAPVAAIVVVSVAALLLYALYVVRPAIARWAERPEPAPPTPPPAPAPPPAAAPCQDCSRLPELTLAAFRAHYGDRVTAFLRHFDRLDEAIVGEMVTGSDGMVAVIQRVEVLLKNAAADAAYLRAKHHEWEVREAARKEALAEARAEHTNPGKAPR